MADYHNLKIFKYEHPTADINAEYQNRLNSPTSITTNLKINPMNDGIRQSSVYPLFLLPIQEILQLQDQIQQNATEITRLMASLPGIASSQMFLNTLSNEIRSTNEIEGVKTTNKEVNQAIIAAQSCSEENSRLQSFARMYLKIQNRENLQIHTLDDIRKIYDFLLAGEIAPDRTPDGKLFRDRFVRIGNELNTVHLPKEHETDFSSDLIDWIAFINDDTVPFLIKAFIAHYYFEYIHPFNDGNGRTGRYIACVYIGYKLDPMSAITFSSEINKSRNKYYSAFQDVSDEKNRGEITFFVLEMMKILAEGQTTLIRKFRENSRRLEVINTNLKAFSNDSSIREILFIYAQAYLFNDVSDGLEDRELKLAAANIPNTQIRRKLDLLTKSNTLEITKHSPLTRKLTQSFINQNNF
ncbi:Fic family protein [Lentilactobacillus kisonensis]|uniref:Fic family protein n=1 Tax=Lentilactobacillus kisonensis F0435 TaxID=797516 RepID=H1LDV6_9LACO|nr:Fic family protein [Lentilactobacillus kisonensis]EHO53022.1 Fic family protein [Lentilactobacillus kisonensis F0435]